MDLIDQLKVLSSKIAKQLDIVKTEEATKNAFVMPFISALGYNVFDPSEVTPELIADVGVKKGEKVDYAILKEGKPIILFECKWCGANLDETHASHPKIKVIKSSLLKKNLKDITLLNPSYVKLSIPIASPFGIQ